MQFFHLGKDVANEHGAASAHLGYKLGDYVHLPSEIPNGTVLRYTSGGLQLRLDEGMHSRENGGQWAARSREALASEGVRLIHEAPPLSIQSNVEPQTEPTDAKKALANSLALRIAQASLTDARILWDVVMALQKSTGPFDVLLALSSFVPRMATPATQVGAQVEIRTPRFMRLFEYGCFVGLKQAAVLLDILRHMVLNGSESENTSILVI
jgi:hypothetical protein